MFWSFKVMVRPNEWRLSAVQLWVIWLLLAGDLKEGERVQDQSAKQFQRCRIRSEEVNNDPGGRTDEDLSNGR